MTRLAWAFVLDSVPFTRAVINGETSLGGSESACVGLARALRARGHRVDLFTTQIAEDACGVDATGVTWHDLADFPAMNEFIEWDVVCALRTFRIFAVRPVYARLRILWNEDLLVPGQMQNAVMGMAWAVDRMAYVSEYHRRQWEDLEPHLAPIGWVTRNGFDLSLVPEPHETPKDPHRIIHVSRPERGLAPLLAMWPALRQQHPEATLQICRYSSMYDQGPGSWSDTCAAYDREVARVNAEVGGITYLGELNKPDLYRAISEAAVMWYPGVATFAETGCLAAVEAAACGTPFVGSLRGALPETARPSYEAGLLIDGDAEHDEAYQQASLAAVLRMLDGCARQAFAYRKLQREGRAHAQAYDLAVLAEQWETQVLAWFGDRYLANQRGVLRQLLHEDDHVAARIVATELGDTAAVTFCDRVIAGKDQTDEHYAEQALPDPLKEAEVSDRFAAVVPLFEKRSAVLDVACGNGSFAIAVARAHPAIHVHGLDYAAGNIDRARDGAVRAGVADRCTFERLTVYDYDRQDLHADCRDWLAHHLGQFDGLFVGEFIEHTANYRAVIDGLEDALENDAQVVYTCPHGACAELVPRGMPLRRGHVHRYHFDDVEAVWGTKAHFGANYLAAGITERGVPLGNWLIGYRTAPNREIRAGERPLAERIVKTRPLQKLSVGLIVKDAETDLGRCLASVWKIADEIVVGDTGSSDASKAIAESYGARVIDLAPIAEQPDGFAGARNQVLAACTGDWFLWIDSDEFLLEGHLLRRYLDGAVFHGYVIPQTHLYIDGPPTVDVPVRLFRHTGRVKFFGAVHEQPQDGDPNADITPTLHVADLTIAHLGYLTEHGRETKRVMRNLPLLMRDQAAFPNRLLGKVLLVREAVIQSDLYCAQAGGTLTPKAAEGYTHAVQIFQRYFDDPAGKFWKIARPWYEAALQHLGIGWEVEFALAGRAGGLDARHAKPERFWVRDAAEFDRIARFKVGEATTRMQPVTFHTAPFTESSSLSEEVSA